MALSALIALVEQFPKLGKWIEDLPPRGGLSHTEVPFAVYPFDDTDGKPGLRWTDGRNQDYLPPRIRAEDKTRPDVLGAGQTGDEDGWLYEGPGSPWTRVTINGPRDRMGLQLTVAYGPHDLRRLSDRVSRSLTHQEHWATAPEKARRTAEALGREWLGSLQGLWMHFLIGWGHRDRSDLSVMGPYLSSWDGRTLKCATIYTAVFLIPVLVGNLLDWSQLQVKPGPDPVSDEFFYNFWIQETLARQDFCMDRPINRVPLRMIPETQNAMNLSMARETYELETINSTSTYLAAIRLNRADRPAPSPPVPEAVRLAEALAAAREGRVVGVKRVTDGQPEESPIPLKSSGYRADYSIAIETRLAWLRWAKVEGISMWSKMGYAPAMPAYEDCLEHGDTFCMVPRFCRLVDHARREVPDTLKYEATWLHSRAGWLWIVEPFLVPQLAPLDEDLVPSNYRQLTDIRVCALGWRPIPRGSEVVDQGTGQKRTITTDGQTQFCFFQDFRRFQDRDKLIATTPGGQIVGHPREGFGCWSYFILRDGQLLGERIEEFERRQARKGAYLPTTLEEAKDEVERMQPRVEELRKEHPNWFDPATGRLLDGEPAREYQKAMAEWRREQGRATHPLHELRWLYTALHLMAQKLAVQVHHEPDRATRRRVSKAGGTPPPFIRVITLRRLEQDRRRAGAAGEEVSWNWQWEVTGHWRNQYYPSEGIHKDVYIEAYIKGPPDKPLRPGGVKLFVARR